MREEKEKMIFESHTHLDDRAFDEDREEIIAKLKESEVKYIMNISAGLSSAKTSMELARKYDFIYTSIGVHPCETEELNEDNFLEIISYLKEDKVKAIGEIGLDYYWNEPKREIQQYWFRRQLKLAHEYDYPVIIHSRDAAFDTYQIMKEEKAEDLKGVIHCYSYTKETARNFLNWNYYFGIGGVITFQNAKKLKEAVEYIPLENIVLETDSPYLSPVPYRGKRNSPLNLPLIADTIAEIKKVTSDEVKRITTENAKRLYRL